MLLSLSLLSANQVVNSVSVLHRAVKQSFAGTDRSDHIALLRAYDGWRAAYREKRERDWCWENFLSTSTLHVRVSGSMSYLPKFSRQMGWYGFICLESRIPNALLGSGALEVSWVKKVEKNAMMTLRTLEKAEKCFSSVRDSLETQDTPRERRSLSRKRGLFARIQSPSITCALKLLISVKILCQDLYCQFAEGVFHART
jgi:HrpA-like RNA helicase